MPLWLPEWNVEKKVAELKTEVAIDCGPISTIFREDMAELRQEDTFILDGTLKIVPGPYKQLYTFHADIGSNTEYTKVIPCIYSLLPNKKRKTYNILFAAIKNTEPNFQPNKIKVDFETAVINIVKSRMFFSF